jgi:hypothetical protein
MTKDWVAYNRSPPKNMTKDWIAYNRSIVLSSHSRRIREYVRGFHGAVQH